MDRFLSSRPLDAQREAGEAFIASQKSEGWVCLPDKYDDSGYTGGNMDRPAFKRLMADVEAGRKSAPFYFYRDKDQKEIDLLIVRDEVIHPLEFKKSASPGRDSVRHFGTLARLDRPRGSAIRRSDRRLEGHFSRSSSRRRHADRRNNFYLVNIYSFKWRSVSLYLDGQ